MSRLLNIFSTFGPESPVKEKGDSAEACRPKEDHMLDIATETRSNNRLAVPATYTKPSRPAELGISYAGTLEMTPADWAKVYDNPRQRDTAAHAKKADHLRAPHPAHIKVNAARLPDGSLYKLDGHTRSFLWHAGEVAAPQKLYVDIWNCRDIADVKGLYSTFDSRGAVETVTDQMFGGVKDAALQFESELLRSNRYAGALRSAYELLYGQTQGRRASIYDLLDYWQRELLLLDECAPSRVRFTVGITTAALITFRRCGRGALDFWNAYARNAGFKLDGEVDPVQALSERIMGMRASRSLSGRDNIIAIVAVALSAFDRHRRGETYSGKSSGIKALKNSSLRAWLIAAKNVARS